MARTETVAACPLTLAMNFTEEVRPGARLAAPRLPWPAGFAAPSVWPPPDWRGEADPYATCTPAARVAAGARHVC